jgi:hypothetical protein
MIGCSLRTERSEALTQEMYMNFDNTLFSARSQAQKATCEWVYCYEHPEYANEKKGEKRTSG